LFLGVGLEDFLGLALLLLFATTAHLLKISAGDFVPWRSYTGQLLLFRRILCFWH